MGKNYTHPEEDKVSRTTLERLLGWFVVAFLSLCVLECYYFISTLKEQTFGLFLAHLVAIWNELGIAVLLSYVSKYLSGRR